MKVKIFWNEAAKDKTLEVDVTYPCTVIYDVDFLDTAFNILTLVDETTDEAYSIHMSLIKFFRVE